MIKNALLILLTLGMLVAGLPALAQQKEGSWTIYPIAGRDYTAVVDGKDKTYMLNTGALYSLSHEDNELYTYNALNKLSEQGAITGIYYNDAKGYLVATYESGNIDLIYDNGRVVNMADIKDAVLNTSHEINDIAFSDGRIYAATKFGIVVFDDEKHHVVESGLFNDEVQRVMVMDGNLLVLLGAATPYKLYAAPLDGRHSHLDHFKHVTDGVGGSGMLFYTLDMQPLGDSTIAYGANNVVYAFIMDFATTSGSIKKITSTQMSGLRKVGSEVYAVTPTEIVKFDAECRETHRPLDEALRGGVLFFNKGLESVWQVVDGSLSRYDASGSTLTKLMSDFALEGLSMPQPAMLNWDKDGNKLYISNYEVTHYYTCAVPAYNNTQVKVTKLENGELQNVGPKYKSASGINLAAPAATGITTLGGPSRLVVDIDDPDLYYISTVQGAGLAAIKNGEILNTFTYQDLGFDPFWLDSFIDARIDNDGNLWVGHANAKGNKIYAVLPSAKRKNLASVKTDDWHIVSLPADFTATRDLHMTFCKKSNYYFSGSGLTHGILIIDNNGTPSNFKDDKSMWQQSICDEAGNVLDPASVTSIVEDENGHVWIGTDIGVFVITDFAGVMKSTLTVKRPIVARNDGTNLGDYLLDGEGVYQIAVDHSNRKWFASQTSGVYLTSADGTEILNHYTTDNSPLPSNCVYAVACDPHSNKVYFATKSGLVAYDSDSSPAAEDFSEVYAYPNPVRPEYTGWITVAGLMDNSLVKIADAAGNVFFQGRSEGGMIAWDGCDPSGKRVRSGVYFVFASNSESGSSSSCVTKIMVIN